jgi:hypothetical protein
MRAAPLTVINSGINRLRIKGGARADTLYDLLNGYVTQAKTVKVRAGTTRYADLSGLDTAGLATVKGQLAVFSISVQAVPTGFVNYVLQDPNDPTQDIVKIHFAKPFLGFPYVVAEFANGDIFHYWLRDSGVWTADTDYLIGDIVTPATNNQGIAFEAVRISSPNPTWQANSQITEGQIVEPSVYDGFFFTATETDGDNPHTGATEPAWNAADGATTIEQADATLTSAPTVTPNPTNTLPAAIAERYSNPAQPQP